MEFDGHTTTALSRSGWGQPRRHRGSKGRVLGKRLQARPFVADFAFEPEHSEIPAEDSVEVVARLVLCVSAAGDRRRKGGQARRKSSDDAGPGRGRGSAGRRALVALREGGREMAVPALREQDAPFESDIAGSVAGRCRTRKSDRRAGGEKIFT